MRRAEKLEALTKLSLLISPVKDYYDLALLSRTFPFKDEQLLKASARRSYTALQWRAFVRRSRFTEQRDDLKQLVHEVRQSASPLLLATGDQKLSDDWPAGGPMSPIGPSGDLKATRRP